MLKLGRVTKVKVLFLVVVFVFHFDLFKFSAAILEKGLLHAEQAYWGKSGDPAGDTSYDIIHFLLGLSQPIPMKQFSLSYVMNLKHSIEI